MHGRLGRRGPITAELSRASVDGKVPQPEPWLAEGTQVVLDDYQAVSSDILRRFPP